MSVIPNGLQRGNMWCLAALTAYKLEIDPPSLKQKNVILHVDVIIIIPRYSSTKPGANIPSPSGQPTNSIILFITSFSIRIKTGDIS